MATRALIQRKRFISSNLLLHQRFGAIVLYRSITRLGLGVWAVKLGVALVEWVGAVGCRPLREDLRRASDYPNRGLWREPLSRDTGINFGSASGRYCFSQRMAAPQSLREGALRGGHCL